MRYCFKCGVLYKYGESALNHACDPIDVIRNYTQGTEFKTLMKALIKEAVIELARNREISFEIEIPDENPII